MFAHFIRQIPTSNEAAAVEGRLNCLLQLARGLKLAGPLSKACASIEDSAMERLSQKMGSPRLPALAERLENVLHVEEKIDHNPLQQRRQRIFAVRHGVHGEAMGHLSAPGLGPRCAVISLMSRLLVPSPRQACSTLRAGPTQRRSKMSTVRHNAPVRWCSYRG